MPTLFLAVLAIAAQAVSLPRDVVYLPQTEALCGGAASAMVMRYWGDTTVRAEDFAPLVDRDQEGIVTTALVAHLRARGWQAFPLRGSADDTAPIAQHLSRGRPIIALIEDRPSRFHYVVVTGLTETAVRFHDPAVAPSQSMPRAEFDRRWQAANFWMLLLLPGTHGTIGTEPVEPAERTEPSEPQEAGDVANLLRRGALAEALRISTEATERDPRDKAAWDALATTWFVMDRELDALDAWNRADKPVIDTVQISGLAHTRYRAAEALIALEPGDRLARRGLSRARRRLALLPSAAASRVGYTPLADGRVQIDAAIVERSRLPGLFELAVTGAKAPFSHDVAVSFTNLVGGGERVTGSWRFREGFERIEASVELPAPLPVGAVWKLSGFDARETFLRPPGVRATLRWRRAGLQATDWITPWLGWTAGAGFERWPDTPAYPRGNKAYVGGRALVARGSAFDGYATLEGWIGKSRAIRATTEARLSADLFTGRGTLRAGWEAVHGDTPGFIIPGAGDGNIRRPLLRAHPLIQDGMISVRNGQIVARRLVFGTAEWTRPLARVFVASIEGAAFVDGAYGRQLIDGRLRGRQIDAGVGLRVRAPGAPTFRLDIARGLRDGEWALTAGTVVGFDSWIF